MHVITAVDVNDALAQGLEYIFTYGKEEPSRNGPVLVAPTPVTTKYLYPHRRVLFSPTRDANPVFHCLEALWMLAGHNDIAFPKKFNSKFGAYSDDGVTQRGAYGYRWRQWFGYDQLKVIIDELKTNSASRRCVLAMWDGGQLSYWDNDTTRGEPHPGDLLATTVDKPCNTHIYFRVRDGVLDMTVCCRSNDILWGAYGANAVHMSFLLEYMATAIGVSMGVYYQVSNNYHLYTDVLGREKGEQIIEECHGALLVVENVPLVANPETFDKELQRFMQNPGAAFDYENEFLGRVGMPMYLAWEAKSTSITDALAHAAYITDTAWRLACTEWLERLEVRRSGR
jgi:thymidylate synthase